MAATNAHQSELKRLLETSDKKLAADIAASKKELAALTTRLDAAAKPTLKVWVRVLTLCDKASQP